MKKVTLVAMVLVLCLAALGVGYAKWNDQINLTGTVTTGYLSLEIVDYSGTWVYKNLTTHQMECWDEEQDDPNLLYIAGAWAVAVPNGENSAHMVWDNLFPTCEECAFTADVRFHYAATVPGVVSAIDFVPGPDSAWLCDPELAEVEIRMWIYDSEDADRIGMVVEEGTQLHHCDYIELEVTIRLIQTNANMNLTASGSATILVEQWAKCPEPQ